MSDRPICPCEIPHHPRAISNAPGLDVIRYRAGDYLSFRDALLRGSAGEVELVNWAPGAEGDLAVQMMEWWAYLADILTFYDERIANQAYLRTADLPGSLRQLIRLLGYRPRPGIGASAGLGVILAGPKAITLDAGFQVQSRPGPGKQPQIFELNQATTIASPIAVAAQPATDGALFAVDGSVLLSGAITAIKPDDTLLILEAGWSGANDHHAWVKVTANMPEPDPLGRPNTRLQLHPLASGIPADARSANYRLLRATQSAKPWPYDAGTVIDTGSADLDSVQRGIAAGQPVLFDIGQAAAVGHAHAVKASHGKFTKHSGSAQFEQVLSIQYLAKPAPQLVSVTAYGERVWFANPKAAANPAVGPDAPAIGIAVPHSFIDYSPELSEIWNAFRGLVTVRHGWQDAGTLIATPAAVFNNRTTALVATPPGFFRQGNAQPVLIEDANGNGIAALGSVGNDTATLTLSTVPDAAFSLAPPLTVYFAPLQVTRGKSVPSEILGSGDAAQANQSFVLKNKPLTYLPDPGSASGNNFASTLRIWVDGIEWHEQPSFYGQPPDARVFATREDDTQATTVSFGDGINGARLSSGISNLVASYRYGSGADSPASGTLSIVAKPLPGLRALRNPVAATGGADPDPPDKIRRYAPRSVLTFNRAVSGDDYEVVAAQAPGVARARAYFGWDSEQQRAMVLVYVGDGQGAENAARAALNLSADPNRLFTVKQATPVPVTLSLTVLIDADRAPNPMLAALRAALTDPDTGLFGINAVRIGASIYRSAIHDRCLDVPGTVAVHALTIIADRGTGPNPETGFRIDPGEGCFFTLDMSDPARLDLTLKVAANAG